MVHSTQKFSSYNIAVYISGSLDGLLSYLMVYFIILAKDWRHSISSAEKQNPLLFNTDNFIFHFTPSSLNFLILLLFLQFILIASYLHFIFLASLNTYLRIFLSKFYIILDIWEHHSGQEVSRRMYRLTNDNPFIQFICLFDFTSSKDLSL